MKYRARYNKGKWYEVSKPNFENMTAYAKANPEDNWFGWSWLQFDEIVEVTE
jgi:hypothetical protein